MSGGLLENFTVASQLLHSQCHSHCVGTVDDKGNEYIHFISSFDKFNGFRKDHLPHIQIGC